MALKHKLDSLDGLDEALKPLYAKGDDGRFTLQVDEAPATNTIAKLKADLDAATKALKERSDAEAKAIKDAETARDLAAGNYEKVSAADKAALKAAQDEASALKSKLLNGTRDRALMEAMSDPTVKGIPKALLPHIQDQVEVVPDGDGFKVVPKANPAQKLTDFVNGFKADMAWGFEGSGMSGGGAGTPGKPSGNGFDKMTKTELALAAKNPATAAAVTAFIQKTYGG
jgi:hypothetical protein